MSDVLLHAGHGHMNLWWVLLPVLVAFAGGLGLGVRSRRRGTDSAESPETATTAASQADSSETHYNAGEN